MNKVLIPVALILIILGAALGLTRKRWEGQPPEIRFDHDFKALGHAPSLQLKVDDSGTGLRHVKVQLKMKDQDVVLADESFDKPGATSANYDVGKLMADKVKIEDGPATLSVTASDFAYRDFLKGNRAGLTKDFSFHVTPPRLEIISGQHYINQGGSECIVYRVSGDAEVSGVQVGPHFFPGFAANLPDKDLHFALFGFAYDLPADTRVQVIARDAAGNQSVAEPWQKVFPRKFEARDIVLDDNFVQKAVTEITSHTPALKDQGDVIKNFVQINSMLRHQNHETIAKLAKDSVPQFLWNGSFLQLSNSKVEAHFADRRTYMYHGMPVDQQDHVGFDLSVVQHNPIEAGNDGKVILAEYFGIYGNTVLIDHGYGLISLYGHMSSIDAKPGQMVKKKDILGRSGETGLAAGDHLHFGLFLQGVPINPTEWWDAKWIQEHVLDRLKP